MNTKRYTILAFMLDRPGVLNKISMLIRKKMYNIDTLTVCRSNKPGISRMTITLTSDDEEKVLGMAKQIERLVEVISAKSIDPDVSFWREVALAKLILSEKRLEELQKDYFFNVLHLGKFNSNEISIIQIAGTVGYIDEFLKEVGENNIIEIARSGPTALEIEDR